MTSLSLCATALSQRFLTSWWTACASLRAAFTGKPAVLLMLMTIAPTGKQGTAACI